MKNQYVVSTAEGAVKPTLAGDCSLTNRPALSHFVNRCELEDLRNALSRGQVPSDLGAKLERLADGDLLHRFVAQNCWTFITLLQAAQSGTFKDATVSDREWLLRVLAYVRENDDAIPDYRLDGFVDDQKEVRAATSGLAALLQAFKVWHLRHQVPSMWGQEPGRHSLPPVRVGSKQASLGAGALACV